MKADDDSDNRSAPSAWNTAAIVAGLREQRTRLLADRKLTVRPPKLPARRALIGVMEAMTAALFPNRLGQYDLADDGIDYFVGHTLDVAFGTLCEQIERELFFFATDGGARHQARTQATAITRKIGAALPAIRGLLETDIRAAYEGDPAARSVDEILACYPGITAVIHHRIAHQLYLHGAPLVGRIVAENAHSATGIDIHPGAQIGRSFFIDHGTGVVIGETAVIGTHVRLYQAVTLGAKRFPAAADGTLLKGNPRHPIVEDDVVIYSGATILGRVTIGRGSVIGGNVWLTHSVPPGSNITQANTRIPPDENTLP